MANAIEKIVVHHDHQGETEIRNLPAATANGMPVTKEQHDLKQDIMTVAPGSTSFLSIDPVTSQISISNVAITKVHVDTTSVDMDAFITAEYSVGNEFQEGDLIILTQSTSTQARNWVHNGGTAGTIADFTRVQADLVAADVRSFFGATAPLAFDSGTGKYSVTYGNGIGELGAHVIPVNSTLFSRINQSDVSGALVAIEDLAEEIETASTNLTNALATRLDGVIGAGATATSMGIFTGTHKPETNSTVKVCIQSNVDHIDAIVIKNTLQDTVLGVGATDANLGAFTDTVTPNNSSVKVALQAHGTAIEDEIATRTAEVASLTATIATNSDNTDAQVALRTQMYKKTIQLTANTAYAFDHGFSDGCIVQCRLSNGNVFAPQVTVSGSGVTILSEVDAVDVLVTVIGY